MMMISPASMTGRRTAILHIFLRPIPKPFGFQAIQKSQRGMANKFCRGAVSHLSRSLSRWFCLRLNGLGDLSRCRALNPSHICTHAHAITRKNASATARQRDIFAPFFLFSFYSKGIEKERTVSLLSRCCRARILIGGNQLNTGVE
ncbi:MAG: hypothetical protein DI551_00695 [Micavibrio aeruginosavorus]|uniref:Uncharacterized protein n=1 Tax=Micavibrio aeruginosavorus TaxID=349221 RepID=A0A2W5N5V5_9BACT|nr:MAG: hypothetical protein DI551_00695 [Micavibrio aeruginosavorus]